MPSDSLFDINPVSGAIRVNSPGLDREVSYIETFVTCLTPNCCEDLFQTLLFSSFDMAELGQGRCFESVIVVYEGKETHKDQLVAAYLPPPSQIRC